MFSLVINIAIEVNKAVLDDILLSAAGLNTANVLDDIAEADAFNIPVIINKTFFLFKDLDFFL